MKISNPKVNMEEDADLRKVKAASAKLLTHKATVYIPVELHRKAKMKALKTGVSLSEVVTTLLQDYVV